MKYLIFFTFIQYGIIGTSQTLPEYCVYVVKGNVTVNTAGSQPQKINQNEYLFNNQVLSISKSSEITLINKDAKLLVLNTAGTIKVSDLAKQFSSSSPSITKTYLNLVFHELLDPKYDYTKFKQKNLGGIRGGVSRGGPCDNLIFPTNNLKTAGESIHFRWHQTSPTSDYTFMVYDLTGKELLNISLKDTQQVMNISQVLQGKPGKYYWIIKGRDDYCQEQPLSFEIMSKEEEQQIIQSVKVLKGESDLLHQLEIVDELEKNNWIYAAYEYYSTIVKANSDNYPLLKSYVLFLLKYGFVEEAETTWKNIDTIPR
jgi:hypothetical protein